MRRLAAEVDFHDGGWYDYSFAERQIRVFSMRIRPRFIRAGVFLPFPFPVLFRCAMPVVKFLNENKEIEVPEGANLRAEAEKAGIHLNCAISGVSGLVIW